MYQIKRSVSHIRVELEKFLENIREGANFDIIFIVISVVISCCRGDFEDIE
jgi:hypothetical protein